MAYGKTVHSAKEAKKLGMVQGENIASSSTGSWSDCDEAPGSKVVLMANLSSYDSDVIFETESASVQNTASTEQQNVVIMLVFDEITNQVAKCNAESIKNKNVHESLTAELERYKKRVRIFQERQKVDLNDHKKYIDLQMNDMILNKNAKFDLFSKRD
nr:hypothetical protein [Tanacetum cinerariifolium]